MGWGSVLSSTPTFAPKHGGRQITFDPVVVPAAPRTAPRPRKPKTTNNDVPKFVSTLPKDAEDADELGRQELRFPVEFRAATKDHTGKKLSTVDSTTAAVGGKKITKKSRQPLVHSNPIEDESEAENEEGEGEVDMEDVPPPDLPLGRPAPRAAPRRDPPAGARPRQPPRAAPPAAASAAAAARPPPPPPPPPPPQPAAPPRRPVSAKTKQERHPLNDPWTEERENPYRATQSQQRMRILQERRAAAAAARPASAASTASSGTIHPGDVEPNAHGEPRFAWADRAFAARDRVEQIDDLNQHEQPRAARPKGKPPTSRTPIYPKSTVPERADHSRRAWSASHGTRDQGFNDELSRRRTQGFAGRERTYTRDRNQDANMEDLDEFNDANNTFDSDSDASETTTVYRNRRLARPMTAAPRVTLRQQHAPPPLFDAVELPDGRWGHSRTGDIIEEAPGPAGGPVRWRNAVTKKYVATPHHFIRRR